MKPLYHDLCPDCGCDTLPVMVDGHPYGMTVAFAHYYEACTNPACLGEKEPECAVCEIKEWQSCGLEQANGRLYCPVCLEEELEDLTGTNNQDSLNRTNNIPAGSLLASTPAAYWLRVVDEMKINNPDFNSLEFGGIKRETEAGMNPNITVFLLCAVVSIVLTLGIALLLLIGGF